MGEKIIRDLRDFLTVLRRESELIEVEVEVDPYLEIAEIHRRVIGMNGPALLFTKVKGSRFPVVTNLFGSQRRMELAFGRRPLDFVADLVRAAENLTPSLKTLWRSRGLIRQMTKVGTKVYREGPILEECQSPPRLTELPLLDLLGDGRRSFCHPAAGLYRASGRPRPQPGHVPNPALRRHHHRHPLADS
jgi:4-hydroxybenzoate decarboxylase subunit C